MTDDETAIPAGALRVPAQLLSPAITPLRDWRARTSQCEVCGVYRSGLSGDTHQPCRERLALWERQIDAVFTSEEVVAAHKAQDAATVAAMRLVRDRLDGLDVSDAVRERAWVDYRGAKEEMSGEG